MDEHFFDDLAKGLGDGTITRGRALRLVGGALLAVAVPSLFPRPAVASAKKKCHKKGGVFLSKGDCHCGAQCGKSPLPKFICHNNTGCTCFERADGTGGLCTDTSQGFGAVPCSTDADCSSSPGTVCVVWPNCGSGDTCSPSAPCQGSDGCVNGTCQRTLCLSPCPT
jgi:hypothetical protein